VGKLLLWFLIVLAVLTVWRIANARAARREAERNAPPGARRASAQGRRGTARVPAEAMVQCAHCGVHLPRSEALLAGGRTWCRQEHARLGPASGG